MPVHSHPKRQITRLWNMKSLNQSTKTLTQNTKSLSQNTNHWTKALNTTQNAKLLSPKHQNNDTKCQIIEPKHQTETPKHRPKTPNDWTKAQIIEPKCQNVDPKHQNIDPWPETPNHSTPCDFATFLLAGSGARKPGSTILGCSSQQTNVKCWIQADSAENTIGQSGMLAGRVTQFAHEQIWSSSLSTCVNKMGVPTWRHLQKFTKDCRKNWLKQIFPIWKRKRKHNLLNRSTCAQKAHHWQSCFCSDKFDDVLARSLSFFCFSGCRWFACCRNSDWNRKGCCCCCSWMVEGPLFFGTLLSLDTMGFRLESCLRIRFCAPKWGCAFSDWRAYIPFWKLLYCCTICNK